MDDETMTTMPDIPPITVPTSESSPASDATSTPMPESSSVSIPAPESSSPPASDSTTTPMPSDSVAVVPVDELIDRLLQSVQEDEGQDEAVPGDAGILPSDGAWSNDFFSEVDTGPMEIVGMDKLLEFTEAIQTTLDHPVMTTSFQDYTVMEGLLLLILIAAFAAACVKILKGGFQWLRW